MGALPEKRREPQMEEFLNHFEELQNDMLNIEQILNEREKSGSSFDTIAKELESLKEDAEDRLLDMQQLFNQNPTLFPKHTEKLLFQCNSLLQNLHPDYLSQKRWSFQARLLSDFRKNLS
ncbi:MAG: hypothetical protein A2Y28_00900 [Chlamydiae bacterium GWC2_50_10]|nr:MAG: hypothetical protein A2Z85_01145 [Chlamydiae bacterium GWA2_50_15]OGN53781.1 MAG: hypothetical protein A2Y28_00900 [Chlamydiae bacterium GWC2_50_10]OGN57766.1 MAG: hypothetical protein A3D18_04890 [Chlamydiae bacterium RIFCSPHIGHO2_02_FULL_49_29]OGN63442.1 MAG: hypothetical protein A3E26_01355 [Chlamydiae bacterium RIFCSPHIGHO2_12_FULL_49_32]OGN68241.1 MAG: hypothetical protein A3I15_05175 [Chlamydiae bacterium RIFCSPLOWO2_02_FULL_49_12]OGN72864.1 MAG: hypothetical protein A3G30_01620 